MRERCPGGVPTEVVKEPHRYLLRDTQTMHTLPGKAVCPTCGRTTGYYGKGKSVAYHKREVS